MSIEPSPASLNAELSLRKESRQSRLLERAQGRGLFSWMDILFILPVLIFGYVAFSGGEKISHQTLALMTAFAMIVQWWVVRLSMRLNALAQYLLEQSQSQGAQQNLRQEAAEK